MSAIVARDLKAVDSLEVQVLVDNVTDSLSTVPKDVTNEVGLLMRNGTLKMAAGEYRCCAHHGSRSSSPRAPARKSARSFSTRGPRPTR